MAAAVILTIGSELVSGDIVDTNGAWLARQLEALGVPVRLLAAVPDDVELIAEFVRAEELRRMRPIASWRRRYRTRESEIAALLVELGERHPEVLVGSYPSFQPDGPEVEVVVKSSDPRLLAAA